MLLNKRIPINFLFEKIRANLLAILILVLAVHLFDENFNLISIPLAAPTILGTLISLLLAFRTAQAYERWWEARKIWGLILSYSRSFIREVQTFVSEDSSEKNDFVRLFVDRQRAWVYELGDTLRGAKTGTSNKYRLKEEDLNFIKKTTNGPNAILDLHAKELAKLYKKSLVNDYQEVQLIRTLAVLSELLGKAERIKTTIFPRTYSVLVKVLIYVFALMLPFSLVNYPNYVEVSLAIVLSMAFLLIEKIAIYLQDPFESRPTDVSVTAIARTIEINLLDLTSNPILIS